MSCQWCPINYSPAVLLSGGDNKSVVSICSNSPSIILPGGDITCLNSGCHFII